MVATSTKQDTFPTAEIVTPNSTWEKPPLFSEEDFYKLGIRPVPYVTQLYFKPLIDYWLAKTESTDAAEALLAKSIAKYVASARKCWKLSLIITERFLKETKN